MAPTREACRILKDSYAARKKVSEDLDKIQKSIRKAARFRAALKYGIVSAAEFIQADVLSAAGAFASAIAESTLKAASAASKGIIEAVIGQIVKVFLSAPEYTYSLIAFPLEAARQASMAELSFLFKAREEYNRMNAIIGKWLSRDISRQGYYAQMRNALSYIAVALREIEAMIKELDGDGGYQINSDQRNAMFNESRFKRIQEQILAAAQITKPQSIIDKALGITRAVTESQNEKRKELVDKITRKYAKLKKDNDEIRQNKIIALAPKKNINSSQGQNKPLSDFFSQYDKRASNLSVDLSKKRINDEWSAKNEMLEKQKQIEISVAATKASVAFDAKSFASNLGNNIEGARDEFNVDMTTLATSAKMFLTYTARAYIQNKSAQNFCNACYKIKDLVRHLIQEMIKLTNQSGNASADGVIKSLETVDVMLDIVSEKFTDNIKQYNSGDAPTPSKMVSDISVGHGLLISSSALLNGSITDSLIALINADEELYNRDVEMQLFIAALTRIPDWDDKPGVWAVDPANGHLNQYVQLLADATKASMKLVLYMGVGDGGSRRARALLSDMRIQFDTIKRHNTIVTATLYSYEPLRGAEITSVMSLLKQNGLFAAFAASLSIANVVAHIMKKDAIRNGISNRFSDIPTYRSCVDNHGDLFTDDPDAELSQSEASDAFDEIPQGTTEGEMAAMDGYDKQRLQIESQAQNIQFATSDPADYLTG
jgi:hypothetical protein